MACDEALANEAAAAAQAIRNIKAEDQLYNQRFQTIDFFCGRVSGMHFFSSSKSRENKNIAK